MVPFTVVRLPKTPADEVERLLSLRAYSILDTDPEAAFDGLAKIAAHIFGAPIGLVSLVDADRQWFKARYGLDAPETPRDISFCGHAVADGRGLVVPDAHEDERFADNPLVTGPLRIRFYAGAPLRTPDGFTLGTLCALDRKPLQPSESQLETLGLLATQVVDQLEARRGRMELAQQRADARAASERYSVIFETMAEGVVVQNSDGEILSANPAAERVLGLSCDQMAGRTSMDPAWRAVHENGEPFPGEDHPAMVCIRSAKKLQNVIMGVHKPTGELTWIRITSVPRLVADGQVKEVVTTFHDITELKQVTARAHEQERLAMVGTLAAGVGHEINNPLAFVMGNLEFAEEEIAALAGPSPSHRMKELSEVLGEAREGANRIRLIVKGLRALAREDVALYGVDVRAVVESALSMCAHELRNRTAIRVEISDVPLALADESRLVQVLVNLIMNAAQAFDSADPERNQVTVTASCQIDGRIQIAVSDNGPGIPAELQRRIFDPFFSTKPASHGTGLGLSVSRNIMETLGGDLVHKSEPGGGAEFRVLVPAAATSAAPEAEPEAESGPSGRVFVIDDQPGVLNTIRRILARAHHVTTFSDPRAALEALRSGAVVDVILCDVAMPHLSGPDLFRAVIERRPELNSRFVFVTGGAVEAEARKFLNECSNERIDKPFSAADILRTVRRYASSSDTDS